MIKVPESLFCYFEQAGITRTIPPGGLIYMQGEPSGTIYLIKKGRVRIYYIAGDGREVTLAVAGAGLLFPGAVLASHNRQRRTGSTTYLLYDEKPYAIPDAVGRTVPHPLSASHRHLQLPLQPGKTPDTL